MQSCMICLSNSITSGLRKSETCRSLDECARAGEGKEEAYKFAVINETTMEIRRSRSEDMRNLKSAHSLFDLVKVR